MHICRLRTCEGRSVKRFSRTTKVICDQAFFLAKTGSTPCCRLPGQHGTIHTPQARSFTNRKRRKSSRPIYDAVSSLEDHEHADMFLDELLSSPRSNHENAVKLGRIFRGHTCGGPPYLNMRAPEWHSCENLAGYR